MAKLMRLTAPPAASWLNMLCTSSPSPCQQIGRDFVQFGGAAKLHRAHQFDAQMLKHILDAVGAVHAQAPDDRPADQHGAGTERERLEDIGTAPDAAVD